MRVGRVKGAPERRPRQRLSGVPAPSARITWRRAVCARMPVRIARLRAALRPLVAGQGPRLRRAEGVTVGRGGSCSDVRVSAQRGFTRRVARAFARARTISLRLPGRSAPLGSHVPACCIRSRGSPFCNNAVAPYTCACASWPASPYATTRVEKYSD